MTTMIHEFDPAGLASWEGFAALGDVERARLGPSSRWLAEGRMRHFVLHDGGKPIARATAFINPRMQDQPVPTGVFGSLDFGAAFAEREAELRELAGRAFAWLASQGMQRVRGPIDFSTWNRYRCVTQDWGYPPILGENAYEPRYARFFEGLLKPAGTYCSNLITDIEGGKKVAKYIRMEEAAERWGVQVEEIPLAEVEKHLPMFYELASRIFPLDWAFTPIGPEEFAEMMVPVARQAPDFRLMIARDPQGAPIGLVYGYLNPTSPKKTGVIKSMGVVPEYQGRKVAYLLTYRYHTAQLERGYVNFLHAMIKEDNLSRIMSMHFATKVRGYCIYEGEL